MKGQDLFVQLVGEPEKLLVEFEVAGRKIPVLYPFLAFEWMDGADLESNLVVPSNHVELLTVLNLFDQACKCVARLHHLGCFHRDLKPSNFFLHKKMTVKLGDFGTTKVMIPQPQSLLPYYEFSAGDRRYTAPEVLAGIAETKELLSAADLFSLGAMLYQMLTGQELFVPLFGAFADLILFCAHMHKIPESNRLLVFHKFLDGSPKSRLPNLRMINANLPKCSVPLLNQLLEMLSHFDYRQRVETMNSIRNRIRMCALVVKNELESLVKMERRRALRQRM